MDKVKLSLYNIEQTYKLASIFAGYLKEGDIVYLCGELGAGKTEFVKAVCTALGCGDRVKSPSFVIVNEYLNCDGLFIAHIDLYRLESNVLWELGLNDYFDGRWLVFIEWGEKIDFTINPSYVIRFFIRGISERDVELYTPNKDKVNFLLEVYNRFMER